MNEIPISDIVTFLETDLKPVMEVLAQKNVFEVMLNPYQKMNGDYEGHLWYEAHGKGMRQLVNTNKVNLSNYPIPKLHDYVLVKKHHDKVINYHIISNNTDLVFKAIKLCMCYSLKQDSDGINFIEQEEHYKLNELASYIQNGQYGFKEDILEEPINQVLDKINRMLSKMHVSFKLELQEVTNELLTELLIPKYCITKDFQKINEITAEQMITVLASANDKKAHKYEPIVEVQIPFYGHRFTAVLPPVSKFPFFSIRKHSAQVKLIEDYVNDGVMPARAAELISEWVKRRYNILVCGSVGSGKTTLLNTLLDMSNIFTPNDRVGIMEDTPEIQNVIANSYAIATADGVSFSRLLRTSLRLSANRLVAGEIRGPEAYVLLKAMTGGFRGCMGTIHADGAKHALYRFEQCLSENEEVGKIQPVHRLQIASGIQGIASIQKVTILSEVNGVKTATIKRKLTSLLHIKGFDPKYDIYEESFQYKDPESFMLTADATSVSSTDDFAEYAEDDLLSNNNNDFN